MCQSRVAASPDWTTTTGFCCAGASCPVRLKSAARAKAQPNRWGRRRRPDMDSGRVIGSLLSLQAIHGGSDLAGLKVRVQGVAERVAQEVDPHDGDEQRRAGEE